MYRMMGRPLGQWQGEVAAEDVLVVDTPSPAATSNYCTNFPAGACIRPEDEQVVRTKARSAFSSKPRIPQVRGLRGGLRGLHGLSGALGKTCSIYSRGLTITAGNAGMWDPCTVKDLPVCRPPTYVQEEPPITYVQEEPPPIVTFDEPSEPEEPEDDNTSYMVGGILAALAVGAVGYVVFKRKKKKGKRKKR